MHVRDNKDLLVHDDDWLISQFTFPRAMLLALCAESSITKSNQMEPHHPSTNTGTHHTGVSGNQLIQGGISRQVCVSYY